MKDVQVVQKEVINKDQLIKIARDIVKGDCARLLR